MTAHRGKVVFFFAGSVLVVVAGVLAIVAGAASPALTVGQTRSMANVLIFTYPVFPLALAVGFVIGGTYVLFRKRRRSELLPNPRRSGQPDSKPSGRVVAVGCIVMGLFFTVGILTGPSPSWRWNYVGKVLDVQPEAVSSFVISRHPEPKFRHLVQSDVVITDGESIKAICSALNEAEPTSHQGRGAIWICALHLNISEDGAYYCHVYQTETDGCLVVFESDRGFYGLGTRFGNYRTDSLAGILESLSG